MRDSMKLVVVTSIVGVLLCGTATGETVLVGYKSAWKVWDVEAAPPPGWEKLDFDDASWKTAKASFYMPYNDDWVKNMVKRTGGSLLEKQDVLYFRIAFEAERQGAEVVDLELRINAPKNLGVAAYLNGTRVALHRLPPDFDHKTLGKGIPYFTRYDKTKLEIDPKLILDGKNVLAYTVRIVPPRKRRPYRWIANLDARLRALTDKDNLFKAGPLVAGTFRDKAVLSFDTRFRSTAVLKYGKLGAAKDKSLASKKAGNLHIMEVKNLQPDTEYAYDLEVVRQGGAAVLKHADGRFRTTPDRPREFTFGIWGDCRTYPKDWAAVAKAMKNDDALEFTIGLGDFVSTGDPYESWEEQFFYPSDGLFATKPFWPILGNHDSRSKYLISLFPYAGRDRGFTFVYGDARFIGIDDLGSVTRKDKQGRTWIEKALSEAKEKYVFVVVHYPLFASGYHGEWDAEAGKPDNRAGIKLWNEFMPLFEKHKITACFAAHSHFYERSEKDGIAYFVTGGAGANVYGFEKKKKTHPYSKARSKSYHYCRVTVGPDKAVLEAISVSPGDPATIKGKRYDIKKSGVIFDRHEMYPRK